MIYSYCPICGKNLVTNKDGLKACSDTICGWIHWDNPVPAVAVLVPTDNGILLVQRGIEPNKGKWCLPCGFIDPREDPQIAAVREVKEESGINLGSLVLLDARCPVPGKTNQVVILYGSVYASGDVKAGDDAIDAKFWKPEDIIESQIAFPLHWKIIQNWINGSYRRMVIDFD